MAALDGAAMGALVWPTKRNWRLAASDMVHGLLAWEIWTLLGVSDIRQRYKRTPWPVLDHSQHGVLHRAIALPLFARFRARIVYWL
jgi:hypothetical protein